MRYLLVLSFILFAISASAQKRLVLMGSSTTAGYGASPQDSSWANRTSKYYNQNTTDGLDTIVTNLGFGGYNTYHEMPTGFVSTIPNRPAPDTFHNVTKALSFHPDVVIINLPSNDVGAGYTKKETMNNFRLMYQTITSAGAKCYITTSQPRDDFNTALRDSLRTLVDSINLNFGNNAIDFWTDLINPNGNFGINPLVAAGDAIHINNIGHRYVFFRVRDKQVFASNTPLPLHITGFKASINNNNTVTLKWHTEQEDANTNFDIERSADGIHFSNLYTQGGRGIFAGSDYSWIDQQPLNGKDYYRLKITENGHSYYSTTVLVTIKAPEIAIKKLYKPNASTLIVEVMAQKTQDASISIINMAGIVVLKKSQQVSTSSNIISLPVQKLSAGQYYLRIDVAGGSEMKAFKH